jgi:hypothetical protein
MPRSTPWHAPLLALFGSLGFAAAWVLLASALDRQCSWMAVLAALDAALLLRMGRVRRGGMRAAWGVATTAIAIALANWGIAAAEFGQSVGMLPWDSVLRLGAHHAWTLVGLANGSVDIAWLVAGLVIAAVASR